MAQTSQFCTFYLDNLLFGVELKHVKEVGRPVVGQFGFTQPRFSIADCGMMVS